MYTKTMQAAVFAWRVLGTIAFAVPFVPMYLAGACFEALKAGWRAGRADVAGSTD